MQKDSRSCSERKESTTATRLFLAKSIDDVDSGSAPSGKVRGDCVIGTLRDQVSKMSDVPSIDRICMIAPDRGGFNKCRHSSAFFDQAAVLPPSRVISSAGI
jgi:hypothetical protein